jgi:hypothetical protein
MAHARLDADKVFVLRPRSGWGKWLGRAMFLGPVIVLLGYGGWGLLVERRVEERLARLHAAGEPVYAGDFEPEAPATGMNGADDLIRAGVMLERSEEMQAYNVLTKSYVVSLPLTDVEMAGVRRAVSANGAAMGLVESGLGKSQVRWPADFRQALGFQLKPWLGNVRAAATLLQIDALRAHQEGREAEALSRVRQMQVLARAVDRHPESISHLVAGGIDDLAAFVLEDMASDLRVGDGPGAVPAADVRAVIATLLDDGSSRAGLVRALQNTRKDDHLLMRELGEKGGECWRPFSRFMSRPFCMGNADLMVRMDTAWIEAFRGSADLPAARASGDVARMSSEIGCSRWNMLAHMFTLQLDGAVRMEYCRIADCRMAAVALAVRLYASEHDGARPGSLAELTPRYLPQVPADPLARGGAALRLVSEGERAIVYSVGEDGVDDGGSEAARPELRRHYEPGEPVDRWEARDAVVWLDRRGRWFGSEMRGPAGGR